MDLGIEGRVALVMGASKGIGRGIAAALAGEGAHVAIASRSRERLDAVVKELDGHVTAFVADAGDLGGQRGAPRSTTRSRSGKRPSVRSCSGSGC